MQETEILKEENRTLLEENRNYETRVLEIENELDGLRSRFEAVQELVVPKPDEMPSEAPAEPK